MKVCMLKSGFSSQSVGNSLGRFDDFCEGVGCGPGDDGEKWEVIEDDGEVGWAVDSDFS